MKKTYAIEDLCNQCQIEAIFNEDRPLEDHVRHLFELWSTTYANEVRTVAALFQATARVAEGYQESQTAPQTGKRRTLRSLPKPAKVLAA